MQLLHGYSVQKREKMSLFKISSLYNDYLSFKIIAGIGYPIDRYKI